MTLRTIWLSDTRWAEVGSAISLIGWFIINSTMQDGLSYNSFGPLLQLAPAMFWENVCLAVGLFQLFAVTVDVRPIRGGAAILAALTSGEMGWAMIFSIGGPHGAMAFYGVSAALNLVSVWKFIRKHGGLI
jgi:hypothetical protein